MAKPAASATVMPGESTGPMGCMMVATWVSSAFSLKEANDASALAPKKTKTAMKRRKGLPPNSPNNPKSTATICPTAAAIRVARACLSRMARTERSTRPPSIGKAGNKLKATSITLMARSLLSKLPSPPATAWNSPGAKRRPTTI